MNFQNKIESLLAIKGVDEWTSNFCKSLLQQVRDGRTLSEAQIFHLLRKEEEYKDISEFWNAEKQRNYEICIAYYANEGRPYFGRQVERTVWKPDTSRSVVDWEKTARPTLKAYTAITGGKYGRKVLKNNRTPPKYAVGTMVKFRDTKLVANRHYSLKTHIVCRDKNILKPRPFIVMVNDGPTRRPHAAKGSRKYSVLGAGDMHPIETEERMLNFLTKNKKV